MSTEQPLAGAAAPGRLLRRLPAALQRFSATAAAHLAGTRGPRAADVFRACFGRTWTTCLRLDGDAPFVITGDIPAMWLRDAVGQLRPYLAAAADPEVGDVLAAVVRRLSAAVLSDPYANAFNDGPTGQHVEEHDHPVPAPDVWERKYEVDSLAGHLTFGYELWRVTGRTDHLGARFAEAAATTLALWRTEQDHEAASPYRFERRGGEFATDTLPRNGLGAPVARTGLTWSAFRPSDDRCAYGYLVPANAAAVVALEGLVDLAGHGVVPAALGADAARLAGELAAGLVRHGIVPGPAGPVYAYEVDGLGGALLMDDANVPSLLSLPYLGWCGAADPVYRRTRALVLGPGNPYHYAGRHAAGIGSPHTPERHVWPIALCMQGLTATSAAEVDAVLAGLLTTRPESDVMCESFDVDDPARFTRGWFCWADSLFAEFALRLTPWPVPRPLPPPVPEVGLARAEAALTTSR